MARKAIYDPLGNYGGSVSAGEQSKNIGPLLPRQVMDMRAQGALATRIVQRVYPIGSIYVSTLPTDPSDPSVFGFGTWVAFGPGKTLIGIDPSDADFDTAEETGGSKTNTHNHYQTVSNDGGALFSTVSGASPRSRVISVNRSTSAIVGTGVGAAREDSTYDETISIVQPYIVVYMWKRTA